VGGPGAEEFEDLEVRGGVGGGFLVHEGDGVVEGFAGVGGVGDGDVARVADDGDGAGGERGGAEGDVAVGQVGVVGFKEDVIFGQGGEVVVDFRAQFLGFGLGQGGGIWVVGLEEGAAAFGGGEVGEGVDAVRGFGVQDVVVQEDAQPGVAGFGVAGEPDDFAHYAAIMRGPL